MLETKCKEEGRSSALREASAMAARAAAMAAAASPSPEAAVVAGHASADVNMAT